MKEELGLDHFEGRSWTGLHRHALMTCIAYAYLQQLRLAEPHRAERGKKADLPAGTAARAELACSAAGHHRTALRSSDPAGAMSTLPEALQPAI